MHKMLTKNLYSSAKETGDPNLKESLEIGKLQAKTTLERRLWRHTNLGIFTYLYEKKQYRRISKTNNILS